ncbi:uncharacterized protein LOC127148560 isoform X1 [Cucumis melo]|uniref:Uncharacterized protein LOC127148560 isoform X1 n=1 Tax=Cucumis melo TaxID=3656 RepID=A0ABM3KLF8_CUCME|nr:uncharacterized protein LOC127148560 isoform X1 [Cucumis melo]
MQARRTTASQETKQIDAAAIVVATTTHVQMATKDQVNWRFFLLSAKEYFVWLKSQALEKIKRPLYEKHPMSKFAWTIAEDTDSMEWYNICQDALRKVNESYQGKETAGIIQNKVLQSRDEDEEIEFDCANYQLEMMRCLRELNVNNTIGWIGTSNIGGWSRYLGYFILPDWLCCWWYLI